MTGITKNLNKGSIEFVIHVKDEADKTALICAIDGNNREIIDLLLKHHAILPEEQELKNHSVDLLNEFFANQKYEIVSASASIIFEKTLISFENPVSSNSFKTINTFILLQIN